MIYTTPYDIFINLFLCVIDLLILMEFMKRMYGPIPKRKKAPAGLLAFGVMLVLLLHSPYDNSFFIFPISLLCLWAYPKKPKKKLLFESCLFSIIFSYIFILNDITNILPRNGNIWAMRYLIVYHIGLWFLLFLCLRLCQTADENLPLSLWLLFLFIPVTTLVSSVLILFFLNGTSLGRPARDLMHLFMQATFLFINIAVFDLVRRFGLYYKKEKEKALLELQVKEQEQHYKDLLQVHSQVRAIRHDMKNHLQTISLLYDQGNRQELLDYLFSTTDLLEKTEVLISSGNPSIDTLLGLKLAQIKEKGIRCTPRISIPQGLSISFSDTVTILGNILDNALHACIRWKQPCEIKFSLFYQQHTLLIHMENPCKEEIRKPYGTGMQNVVKAAETYSGTVQTQVKDQVYITDIVLYHL